MIPTLRCGSTLVLMMLLALPACTEDTTETPSTDASSSDAMKKGRPSPSPSYAITVSSPAANASVKGVVSMTGVASGFLNLEVSLNGTLLGRTTPSSTGAFSVSIDTLSIPDGLQSLTIDAWDAPAGQPFTHTARVALPLQIANGNPVSSTPPTNALVASCPTSGDAQTCLQTFFNSGSATDTYYIPAGTYSHSGVLVIKGKVMGAGAGKTTLYGTDPANKALAIKTSGTSLSYLGITTATSSRNSVPSSDAVYVDATVSGFEIAHVEVWGKGGAAGVIMYGGSSGKIHDNYIHETNADCIHNTDSAHDNEIWNNVLDHCGDDSVAIVGYSDAAMPYNINVHDNTATNQDWGRGYSCVGGRNSVIQNNYFSTSSFGAGIYVAAEPAYGSVACHDLVVSGNTVKYGGSTTSGHSAILVWNGSNTPNLKNITITGNQGYKPATGRFIALTGGAMSGITVTNNASYQDSGTTVSIETTISSLVNTGNTLQPSSAYPGDKVLPKTSTMVLQ